MSYGNALGASSRGASNSIHSPGVAALFGGANPVYEQAARPQTAQVNTMTFGAGNNGTQAPTDVHRYTNTFKSSAFTHSQYQPPFNPERSAAQETLDTVGTSIEDYGRRSKQDGQVRSTLSQRTPANDYNKRMID